MNLLNFSQALALFTIGILIGAVISNLVMGYQIETLYSEKTELNSLLQEKESQIKALEEKVSEAKRWLLVKEIQVEVELPEREFPNKQKLYLEIEKQVKNMLKDLRGKRVKELDPHVVWHIIDGRQIEALDYKFTLEVKGVLISEKIFFYIFAKFNNQIEKEPF